MKATDLDISELVEFDSDGGVIRFAAERALIIDATAKGTLRKELIDHFGLCRQKPRRLGRLADVMEDLLDDGRNLSVSSLSQTRRSWLIGGLAQ